MPYSKLTDCPSGIKNQNYIISSIKWLIVIGFTFKYALQINKQWIMNILTAFLSFFNFFPYQAFNSNEIRNKRQRTSSHYFVDYLLQFSNWTRFVQMGRTLFWSIVAIFFYYNSVKDLQDMEWKHSSYNF